MAKAEISISVTGGGRGVKYELDSDLNGEITLFDLTNFVQKAVIATAKEVRREEESKGFDKKAVVVVDGKANVPEEFVRPFGKIEYISGFQQLEDLTAIYIELLKKSPVRTGTFKNNHYVFHNNKLVATNYFELQGWLKDNSNLKSGDFIRFLNATPYASKLEAYGITVAGTKKERRVKRKNRGGNAGKGVNGVSSRRRENGAYYQAYQKFAKSLRSDKKYIKYLFYRNGSAGITVKETDSPTQAAPFRSSYKKTGQGYFYPMIILRVP